MTADLRFYVGGDLHFLDELREQNRLASSHRRLEAYISEGALDQIVQALQAALVECSGAAADGHCSASENAERERRRSEVVTQFVRESTHALSSLVGQRLLPHSPVFGHCLGDGVVETAVQGVKFVNRDVRVELEGQLGHRLAQIAIVVNHLAYGESHAEHVVAAFRCGRAHFVREWRALQRLNELIDEERDAFRELCFGYTWSRSRCNLYFGARDDVASFRLEELV